MKVLLKRTALLAAAAAAALPGFPGSPAAANASTAPVQYCGTTSRTAHVPRTTYYAIHNASVKTAYTCFTSQGASFTLTRVLPYANWGYPNISTGWSWGRNPCLHHSGACYGFPVTARTAAHVTMSVITHLSAGEYNSAYDIWFSKTDAHPDQPDGTELMIWLAHPGLDPHATRAAYIDHVRYHVMSWITFHNGVHWRYVAYISDARRDHGTWRLGPLVNDAIRNGYLKSSYWMTSVSFGFEIIHGGVGNQVNSFTFTGLPVVQGMPDRQKTGPNRAVRASW